MTCTLYSRSIGWVPVDLFIEETAKDELEIADHPVESGANISDHAWVKPRELTISGMISGGAMTGYVALRNLQTAREPFDIISGFDLYQNMLLQSLEATRDKETGQICSFEATCREVIIVNTEQSQGDTAGYDRGSRTVQRGQVQARVDSSGMFDAPFSGAKQQ